MDLTTRYLGMTLKCPLMASAGPLTAHLDNIRRLEDFGAGAVVLPSIFEEQIEQERQLVEHMDAIGADSFSEALTYFPAPPFYRIGPDRYLETIRQAKTAVEIPVVGSLNGTSNRGWIDYAHLIEQAGADALELNIYMIATDPTVAGCEIEQRYVSILKAVKQSISIPVSVKLNPYFSSTANMAAQLVTAGADGLVLFNRFYQPDIDLVQLKLLPNLELSTPAEIRLTLLWIGLLSGRIGASLAASTGVETSDEVVKYLLAGADVVMTTSALLRHGVAHMKALVEGLTAWLSARSLERLDQIRGKLNQREIGDPSVFARANYIRMLQSFPA